MTDLPVDQLRAAYADWAESRAQKIQGFVDLAGPELRLNSPILAIEDNPESPVGPEAVRQFLGAIQRDWIMLDFRTDAIVAERDIIVWIGHCTWRHRNTEREVSTAKIDVWKFQDGRATSFLESFDTLAFARGVGMV